MKLLGIKILTTVLLICMILASSYSSLVSAQEPEWQAQPMHNLKTPDATSGISGYDPTSINAAYKLPGSGGSGTIAIIDAYDDPRVSQDLAAFSIAFSLPAANLEVHKMFPSISANLNWAVEISLDVQWAHAIAPAANILLVEARSASLSDLLSAINYASHRSDVVAISMSWGGSEFNGQTSYNSYFTSSYGATFFASSGDTGGVISWPSSSANVVSVGGTTLSLVGSVYTETAWSGSGGGVSAYEPKPNYQNTLGYSYRATPDVSYNADPNTGFAVYDTYGYSGWLVVGGTSAGAPQWAAIQALGKTASNNNFYAIYNSLTAYSADFRDITTSNPPAANGYDLVTGIGSPLTTNFGAPLAPDFAISTSPSSLTINAGSSGTTTVTVTSIGGFSDPVTLSTSSNWITPPTDPITSPYTPTQLTINVPLGTPAGTYPVTVTGTSGSIPPHSAIVNVQVVTTPQDFYLTANPTSLTIKQGSPGTTTTITLTPSNNYPGSPTLTAKGAPNGMTITFTPNSVSAVFPAAIMTINVAKTTAAKTYTITITGTDTAALSHTTTIQVTVTR